jgi:hypothetical protein
MNNTENTNVYQFEGRENYDGHAEVIETRWEQMPNLEDVYFPPSPYVIGFAVHFL